MKNFIKKFVSGSGWRLRRGYVLLFISVLFSVSDILAQDTAVAQEGAPSLQNLKKTGSAITEKMKEEARRKEIMSYIYMGIGFSLVIAVAWFSTVKARQYKERQDEKKRKFLEAKMAGKLPHPHTHRDPHRKGHPRR